MLRFAWKRVSEVYETLDSVVEDLLREADRDRDSCVFVSIGDLLDLPSDSDLAADVDLYDQHVIGVLKELMKAQSALEQARQMAVCLEAADILHHGGLWSRPDREA